VFCSNVVLYPQIPVGFTSLLGNTVDLEDGGSMDLWGPRSENHRRESLKTHV